MGSLSRGTKADQFSYVPAGTVLPFAGDTAPSGWAICNGDPVSRTDYAELFTAIGELWGVGDGSTTFNLPDMKGQFLRGLDTSGVVDPDGAGRVVGDNQADEFASHTHQYIRYGQTTSTGGFGIPPQGANPTPQFGTTTEAGGNETRPKNITVNIFIKINE